MGTATLPRERTKRRGLPFAAAGIRSLPTGRFRVRQDTTNPDFSPSKVARSMWRGWVWSKSARAMCMLVRLSQQTRSPGR